MEIQHQEHGKKGAFFIEQNDEWIAEMTYQKEGSRKIIIDHTEVDESMQNQGYGRQLVEAAVEYARENNLLIKPVCSFAKEILSRSEDYEDVLTR